MSSKQATSVPDQPTDRSGSTGRTPLLILPSYTGILGPVHAIFGLESFVDPHPMLQWVDDVF
jgi:hypothetical protein